MTPFNRHKAQAPPPRTVQHKQADGTRCPGSRLTVHPNTVMENSRAS